MIGIEEPELGLHPDLLPKVADLLVEASRDAKLIVTTHSDMLVDALSEQPESIIVCEKHEGKTSMRLTGCQRTCALVGKVSPRPICGFVAGFWRNSLVRYYFPRGRRRLDSAPSPLPRGLSQAARELWI